MGQLLASSPFLRLPSCTFFALYPSSRVLFVQYCHHVYILYHQCFQRTLKPHRANFTPSCTPYRTPPEPTQQVEVSRQVRLPKARTPKIPFLPNIWLPRSFIHPAVTAASGGYIYRRPLARRPAKPPTFFLPRPPSSHSDIPSLPPRAL